MARDVPRRPESVEIGAIPSERLKASWPRFSLPIHPPFPPMEARLVERIPEGPDWLYEPKWDGFRCLAFKEGKTVALQSKSGQPLGRYFPELLRWIAELPAPRVVLDGEIVILHDGRLDFDDLLQRIHPAKSRVLKLSQETPCRYIVFDLLVDHHGRSLINEPLSERRRRLESFLASSANPEESLYLSPAERHRDAAVAWMTDLAASGCDGIVAKRLDLSYRSGERDGMQKIKRIRTADCVVGGFRYDQRGREIGSLLLGLYDSEGRLDHVGFSASFSVPERKALRKVLLPLVGPPGFTGKAPGGPSRWSAKRSTEWEPLRSKLVCEVRFDHFSGDRFRHGTKFIRWRPDKDPRSCTFDQLDATKTPGAFLPFLKRPRR